MPHKGSYGGKTPSKKEKKEAEEMHEMSDGHMMSDKEMKKKKKYMMSEGGKLMRK